MTDTWTTKDGRELKIAEMTTGHIENALAMLERNGSISMAHLNVYLRGPEPRGDGAQMAFESEFQYVCDNVHPAIDAFREELERRNGDERSRTSTPIIGTRF